MTGVELRIVPPLHLKEYIVTNNILFHSYYDNIDGVVFNYHLITFWAFHRCFDILISFTPSFLIEYSVSENIVTQWNELSGSPRTVFSGSLFGWNVPKQLYGEE